MIKRDDLAFWVIIILVCFLFIAIIGATLTSKTKEPPKEKGWNKQCISVNIRSTEETETLVTENSNIIFSVCGETPERN